MSDFCNQVCLTFRKNKKHWQCWKFIHILIAVMKSAQVFSLLSQLWTTVFFSPLHLSLQSSLLHEKHCTQKYIKHSEWIGSCRRRRKQKWYSSQKNNRLFWKCHFFQTACFFIIFFFLRWMICTQKQCSDFCLQRVTFSSVAHTDMESQRAKN